jgi:hypothetical protein
MYVVVCYNKKDEVHIVEIFNTFQEAKEFQKTQMKKSSVKVTYIFKRDIK